MDVASPRSGVTVMTDPDSIFESVVKNTAGLNYMGGLIKQYPGNPGINHYPIFKSDVMDFNSSSTSHFTKGISQDGFSFYQIRHLEICINQYLP